MTDPFRELKNWLIPASAGKLPCVEVDKGIISDFGKLDLYSGEFYFFETTCPIPSKAISKIRDT